MCDDTGQEISRYRSLRSFHHWIGREKFYTNKLERENCLNCPLGHFSVHRRYLHTYIYTYIYNQNILSLLTGVERRMMTKISGSPRRATLRQCPLHTTRGRRPLDSHTTHGRRPLDSKTILGRSPPELRPQATRQRFPAKRHLLSISRQRHYLV